MLCSVLAMMQGEDGRGAWGSTSELWVNNTMAT